MKKVENQKKKMVIRRGEDYRVVVLGRTHANYPARQALEFGANLVSPFWPILAHFGPFWPILTVFERF